MKTIKLSAALLMCSLSVCADNVTEKEAESFKWLSTFFSDDYEKQKPRSGNPSLDKAPIANGLLTKTTRGVYKTAQSLKIHPAKNHYFMPPTAKFFHGQLFRLYAFEGSIESVCSCPLGEFTVKISSVNADTLACETLDYGRRPRRIEFPASALPVDVALYSRRDGGFAVVLTSLSDNSRRTIVGDAAFFREMFEDGFDSFIRMNPLNPGKESTFIIDERRIIRAKSGYERPKPKAVVKPCETFDPKAAGWPCVFEDDFNGTEVDRTKWTSGSLQKKDGFVGLDGEGHLFIKCDFKPGTNVLRSGSVASSKVFRYGYFEARVRLTKNSGWWSAYWLYGSSSRNPIICGAEIDIFEDYYTRAATPAGPHRPILDHNLHIETAKALKSWNYKSTLPGTVDDWHVVGCKWTPFEISYYINGKLMSSHANHSPYGSVTFDAINHAAVCAPLHVKFSGCIMRGWGHRNTEGFKFPEYYKIDYMRVYAMPDSDLPKVTWAEPAGRTSIRDGEHLSYKANASSPDGAKITDAWLFDGGYMVAPASRTPFTSPYSFDVEFSEKSYDNTRYGAPGGRARKRIPWDGLGHFLRVFARDEKGRFGFTEDYRFRIPDTGVKSTPWKGVPHTIPGKFLGAEYDEGPREVAYHSFSDKIRDTRFRKATPFKVSKESVAQLHTGTWLNYTVDVKTSGVYRVELNYLSACKADNKLEMSVDGVYAGTFSCPCPNPPRWRPMTAKPLEGIRLKEGRHVINLMVAGYLSIGSLDFKLVEKYK